MVVENAVFTFAAILLAAVCNPSAWAAGTDHPGKVTLTLDHVGAMLPSGPQDPAHDKACTEQLGQPTSHYVGMRVSTSYSIDPKTLIESATSTFPSPVAIKPVELSVKLQALGLAQYYAFGAFHPPALPDGIVRFHIGLDFKNPVSMFLVANPPSVGYNCWASSAGASPVASDFSDTAGK